MSIKSLLTSLIALLTVNIVVNVSNISLAQTQNQVQPQVPTAPTAAPLAPAAPQAAPAPQVDLQAKTAQKTVDIPCLKPAIDGIQRAYTSLEEDEWSSAIKVCTEVLASVKNLAKTCKSTEITFYQKIAEAFLKYAEGGNHLDGVEEPNCPYALKLYADAISFLNDSIPKISNADVKANAKNIQEYALEEQDFVKNECEDTSTTTTKPAKKAPAPPKQ